MPAVLQEQIKTARELITENREFIQEKETERQDITARFDADMIRYRELTETD